MLAAPSIVTNTNDNGPGSLRQVILETCPNQDVLFDPLLTGQTILLDTEILITGNVSIQGLGMNDISISGNNLHRVFKTLPTSSLTLKDLSLKDAEEITNGGSVFNEGTLILNNVKVSNSFELGVPKAFTNTGNISVQGQVIIE